MKVIFKGQVPKDLSYPESMEDAMAFSSDNARMAISDGASESFDSKTWAQLIVESFVLNTSVSQTWLDALAKNFSANFDLASLSWSKAAAFERGSFATLLGIENIQTLNYVEIISVGDCLAVLLDGIDVIETFPYHSSEQFQQRPHLFCSNLADNKFFQAPSFYTDHQTTWNLDRLISPRILCMSDALGEWALRKAEECNPQWDFLLEISSIDMFKDFVVSERGNRSMKVDDVTLVSISFDRFDGKNELPIS
jgi:hypothetical protein